MLAFILILFLQINSFESSAGVQKSVADCFREAYKLEMHYDFLPCLQVGSDQRPNYLPMEVTNYGLELWPMLVKGVEPLTGRTAATQFVAVGRLLR